MMTVSSNNKGSSFLLVETKEPNSFSTEDSNSNDLKAGSFGDKKVLEVFPTPQGTSFMEDLNDSFASPMSRLADPVASFSLHISQAANEKIEQGTAFNNTMFDMV